MFEEIHPGVLLVTYADVDAMAVARQKPLLTRLEEKRGPVTIVFDVHSGVRSVPMEVPVFWLAVTARADLQLRAFAVVTTHAAVRVAASGFGIANKVRGVKLEVRTFDAVNAATEWARGY